MSAIETFSSTDDIDSKELYHETFKEDASVGVATSSDADVKDMSRMGKDQQFNVSGINRWTEGSSS
jgi:hypothetical protein